MKFFFFLTTALLHISAGDANESDVPQERKLKQIVGGTEAEPGSYPFQVALYMGDSQACGGSLVDQDWVLSAAHCKGITKVIIGAHDLSDQSEDRTEIDVEWETPHPDYDCCTTDNDYMMIKLKTSAPSEYAPIALDDGSTTLAAGDDLKIMGWGTTSSGGQSSSVLLEAEVDYVTNEVCNEAYGGAITDNMFCASRTDIDTCQGDSGGPIIVMGDDTNVQVGVVSWGRGCALESYPGVYASVAEKIDWIENEIENGVAPSRYTDFVNKLSKWGSKFLSR